MFELFQNIFFSIRDTSASTLKKPMLLLGKQGVKMKEMFLGLPPAPATTIYTGILWVIPLAMAGPYASLYGLALGLSTTEIGFYQSLGKSIQPIAIFVGGYYCDVWGRKKSLIFFDILTWGGYCLALALAVNKWWAVAAILFMAANQASTPAYQCLLIEGTKPKSRSLAYSVNQIGNLAPYLLFFPLLGGFWVTKRGLSEANHEMYWFLTTMVVLGVGLRWKFLSDSGTYEKSADSGWDVLRDLLRQHWDAFRKFFKKRASVVFLISRCMDDWVLFMWTIYSSIYYVYQMGLKDTSLSVFALGTSYIAGFVLLFIMPHMTGRWMLRVLGWDQIAGIAAIGILLLWSKIGGNVFWICFLSSGLVAIASVFYYSVTWAVWMNTMDERERAKVVAVSIAFISLILVLCGSACSFLYGHVSPMALLWTMIIIRAINFFLLRRVACTLTNMTKPSRG
jgi:MFS family permease